MFVKICGITSEDDALLAVAMGADAVGFVFAPSPRQVPVQQVYDITRRLPPEIMTVGVFRDEHPRPGRRDRPPLRRQGRAAARQRVARGRRRDRQGGALPRQGLPRRLAADRHGGVPGHRHDPDRRTDARLRPPLRLVARRRAARGDADDPRRRAHPGERRRRGADGHAVGRRRVDRGRVGARQEGPAQGQALHRARPRRRPRAVPRRRRAPYDWSDE